MEENVSLDSLMNQAEGMVADWEPTRIHFGEGAIDNAGDIVKRMFVVKWFDLLFDWFRGALCFDAVCRHQRSYWRNKHERLVLSVPCCVAGLRCVWRCGSILQE